MLRREASAHRMQVLPVRSKGHVWLMFLPRNPNFWQQAGWEVGISKVNPSVFQQVNLEVTTVSGDTGTTEFPRAS